MRFPETPRRADSARSPSPAPRPPKPASEELRRRKRSNSCRAAPSRRRRPDGHVGGFVRALVLAGRLAQRRGCRRSRRGMSSTTGTAGRRIWHSGRATRRPAAPACARHGAEIDRSADQGTGLVDVHHLEFGLGQFASDGIRSIRWPPHMPRDPADCASNIEHLQLGGCIGGGDARRAGETPGRRRRPPAGSGRSRIRRARWVCRDARCRHPCTAGRRGPANRRGSSRWRLPARPAPRAPHR